MKRSMTPYSCWLGKLWQTLAAIALVFGSASLWGSLSPAPASAAGEELRIKSLKMSVWPEYDDPRLLVIYQGEFTDGGTFPREVKFRAPKDASIQMVCALTPKQEHKCQVYDTVVEGDFKTVIFTLPIPTFYFEYYNSQTAEDATGKTINYQFVSPPYTIDSMDLEIQQPLKSTNFAIDPASTSAATDTQGFKYFNYKYSALPADKLLNFAITYTKTDPNPSVEKKSDSETGGQGQSAALIVIAAVGVFILIIGVSYYMFKNSRQQRYPARAPHGARMRQAERSMAMPREAPPRSGYRPPIPERRPAGPSPARPSFCSNCGTELDSGDAFCFNCGLPVPQRGNPAGRRR